MINVKKQKSETRKSEKAITETKQMNKSKSEFLARRGFWFFFPEKKNKKLLVQRDQTPKGEALAPPPAAYE